MSYADEVIIKALNKYKKEQQGDIESGIYIREEKIQFEKQILFDGKMTIMLPKEFTEMSLEMAKIKYPMEQRPQVIKTNQEGTINFTFSLLDAKVENKNIEEVRDGLQRIMKRVQPANIFYEKELAEVDGKTIGWFDYKSHGIDQKIYNLVYVLPIEEKVMHGVFNSPITEMEIWKLIVLEVIQTIEALTLEGE